MLTGRTELPAGFDPNKPKSSDWRGIAALAGALMPPRNNLPPAVVLPDKIIHNTGRVLPGQFASLLGHRHEPWFLEMSPDHPQHDACDLDHSDVRVMDRYGRKTFGWSLLTARCLVETGVSLVQVNLGNDETWDTHHSAFPNLKNYLLPPRDRAVSALLDDLDAGGELGESLVVMGNEFGHTPKISTLPAPIFHTRVWDGMHDGE